MGLTGVEIFLFFFWLTYIVDTCYYNRLTKVVLMSTHNLMFSAKIREISNWIFPKFTALKILYIALV